MTPFNIWIDRDMEEPSLTNRHHIIWAFISKNEPITRHVGGQGCATHWLRLRMNTYREQTDENARQICRRNTKRYHGLRTDTREGKGKGDL